MTGLKAGVYSITGRERRASIIGSPDEAAILGRRRFWSHPDKWPDDPPGHLFLARVVNDIGKAMFPDHWTGQEWNESVPVLLPDQPGWRDKYRANRILAKEPVPEICTGR
jgi:hypothetical protein